MLGQTFFFLPRRVTRQKTISTMKGPPILRPGRPGIMLWYQMAMIAKYEVWQKYDGGNDDDNNEDDIFDEEYDDEYDYGPDDVCGPEAYFHHD